MFNKSILLAFVLIGAAVLYQYYIIDDVNKRSYYRSDGDDSEGLRIAIGLNADLDYIVSATDLLTALKASPGKMNAHPIITNINELQETIAYSMVTCSGIERHFKDRTVFEQIVDATVQLKHEEYIGGNAALMAMKFIEIAPESEVLLAGPIGPKLRKFISRDIETVSPKDTEEEVHVILEFSKGQQWGKAIAKCANRVIISHDIANSRMTALEQFDESLTNFDPGLIIFTGAHMLDGESRDFWKQRLIDIRNILKERPRRVPIHFEMATVGNLQFLPHLADELFPFVDSVGLNEQELVSLAKSKEADFDFKQIGPKPVIPDASDLLHWLYSTYSSQNRTDSRLTRIHFHTLSYHVIVAPKQGHGGAMWKNSLRAVMEGSKVASLQACDAKEISPDLHELQIPHKFRLSNNDEVLHRSEIEYATENGYVAWPREGIDYYMAPVHVCKNPLKTVGLGDAISATGLLTSKFNFLKSKKSKKPANLNYS